MGRQAWHVWISMSMNQHVRNGLVLRGGRDGIAWHGMTGLIGVWWLEYGRGGVPLSWRGEDR